MLNFSEALDVKFDYLICDYLDDSIHSKDPINAEILDMITPLPDNYKRLIRDNIRQLLEKIPPEMGENKCSLCHHGGEKNPIGFKLNL